MSLFLEEEDNILMSFCQQQQTSNHANLRTYLHAKTNLIHLLSASFLAHTIQISL